MISRKRQNSSQLLLLVTAFFFIPNCSWSQSAGAEATTDTAQIVQSIERHDQSQAKALKRYHALRHYEVEYRGFFKNITAKMDVELDYDDNGKNFKMVSESGSHMLCDKVLRRALDSEKDAAQDRGAHALTPANYKFELLGSESVDGRPAYVLQVEPLSGSPYLYRGKIWVDAADGAVSKMDVQPAKNPSFWISQTLVHQTNRRVDGFWLPEQNRSETKVRVGGKATMTIKYGSYQILQSQSPQNPDENGPEPLGESMRASAQ